jgi:hypothetical protein
MVGVGSVHEAGKGAGVVWQTNGGDKVWVIEA